MAELADLAIPVVCAGAGFHADLARLELGKKLEHALASERLAQRHLAAPIYSVQIENLLCDVHPDSCNLHSGPSRSSFSMVTLPSLGSYEAVEHRLGPSHHSPRASRRIPILFFRAQKIALIESMNPQCQDLSEA